MLRIVFYKGPTKIESYSETPARRGYASGFRGLIGFLMAQLPQSEAIKDAIRIDRPLYPQIALRELVANALIHQDFELRGSGPMVEIFADRIEITNPGTPLVDVQRMVDLPHKSRNEKVADVMRKLGICEERGTGLDKVVAAIELWQLPPPDFQLAGDNTRVILFAPKGFAKMTKRERIRACFQHAQLLWVSGQPMTNETLRKRFGIADTNYPQASRVIQETVSEGLVKPYDPSSSSKKLARYVPYWAASPGM